MKILKSGTIRHHKFNCAYCGCEFVASELEYITEFTSTDAGWILKGYRPNYSLSITAYCPTCKKTVTDVKTECYRDKIDEFEDNWKEEEGE